MPPGMTPLTHYSAVGVHLEFTPHPLFDTAFYRRQVPELDVMRVSPLAHYVTVGWRQQLDPHPLFSSAYFRERCADQRVDTGYGCANTEREFCAHKE